MAGAVGSAAKWFRDRRPEILRFYQTEIYGRVPANAPVVAWAVTEVDKRHGRARQSVNESWAEWETSQMARV